MSDFTDKGYQIIECLGTNPQGGRLTYRALCLTTQQIVVIKQFRFAIAASHWSGYKAVEREIQVLQSLDHPGIPRYLDSFDSGDGLCLVQEYKNAPSLSLPRSFDPEEVKEIARRTLEILVYLQQRVPPLIHRDLKPENLLVDEALNVYLIDFGIAKLGEGDAIAASSMTAGTVGFMPPEQLLDQSLSLASDLYSLGVTLICLLTGTKSTEIGKFYDAQFCLRFQDRVSHLNSRFIEWLERMTDRDRDRRYENARSALDALVPLSVQPEIVVSLPPIELQATQLGEKLDSAIATPETGTWQIVSDNDVNWLGVAPSVENDAEARICIDTDSLTPDTLYESQIVLRSASSPEIYQVAVKVQTAPAPPFLEEESAGLLFGVAIAAFTLTGIGLQWGIATVLVILAAAGAIGFFGRLGKVWQNWPSLGRGTAVDLMTVLAAAVVGWGWGLAAVSARLVEGGIKPKLALGLVLCSAGLGASLGWGAEFGFGNSIAIATLLGTGLPLVLLLGLLSRWA
ncbi:MAG: serine/threonine-protein kinase [Cyanobacteriota bacterium]|nr:serine/threonine-protein kinase [Cyanobacteriota bacterium]